MKELEGLNMEEMLRSIAGPGVDLGEGNNKDSDIEEKPETKVEHKAGNVVLPKTIKPLKNENRAYSNTGIRNDLKRIIQLLHPDRSIQSIVNEVLQDWVEKNSKNIQKQVMKSIKSKK